jgi:hypothetical protein
MFSSYISEVSNLHCRRLENLKSHIYFFCLLNLCLVDVSDLKWAFLLFCTFTWEAEQRQLHKCRLCRIYFRQWAVQHVVLLDFDAMYTHRYITAFRINILPRFFSLVSKLQKIYFLQGKRWREYVSPKRCSSVYQCTTRQNPEHHPHPHRRGNLNPI